MISGICSLPCLYLYSKKYTLRSIIIFYKLYIFFSANVSYALGCASSVVFTLPNRSLLLGSIFTLDSRPSVGMVFYARVFLIYIAICIHIYSKSSLSLCRVARTDIIGPGEISIETNVWIGRSKLPGSFRL